MLSSQSEAVLASLFAILSYDFRNFSSNDWPNLSYL